MKTKRSIRKLAHSPLARKAAHLSRAIHGLQKRLDYLTDEIASVEMENRAYEKSIRDTAVRIAESFIKEKPKSVTGACEKTFDRYDLECIRCTSVDCIPRNWQLDRVT